MSAESFAALEEIRGVHRGVRADQERILLVVDRTPQIQRRMGSMLRQAFPHSTVLTGSSVRTALDQTDGRFIDIALIDLELPDGSGVDVIRGLARTSPSTRCVITTLFDDDAHVVPALAAGAMGYLLKDRSDAVLVGQMRLLAEGLPPLAPSVARRVVQYFSAPEAPEQDDLVSLSKREKQVLELLAKGLPLTDVARALEISANTASSHVKSIYRKRRLCTRAEAALEAQRLGLA